MDTHYLYNLTSELFAQDDATVVLGRNVRRLRTEQKLTVTALSHICAMGRPLLSKIENGTSDIRLSYVQRLADALGVSPAELFRP